ncbi:MAG: hypothetical protein VX654_02805 [Chloroflexota bacterium]|nr:hypothetical protein [Chloroflexota bacterium]|tara:strand:+ start:375 stop:617 length:243 start_codon:yes stop_codon:yes gene_type:complete
MDYDYGFTATTIRLGEKITADSPTESISGAIVQPLAEFGERLSASLPTYEGGEWEVVSHSTTRIENNLVVTVMIRRPKTD